MTLDTTVEREPLPTSRAEQTRAKKQRVLDVARNRFVHYGYRAVTMETIARVSAVSKQSLYLWHVDKPALFKACLVDGALRLPVLRFDPDTDIEDDLRTFGVALLSELAQPSSIGFGAVLIREAHEFPEIAQLVRRNREQYLVQPIAEYLYQKGLAGNDRRGMADLWISLLLAPIHNHLLLGDTLPDEMTFASHVRTATAVFLRGATIC